MLIFLPLPISNWQHQHDKERQRKGDSERVDFFSTGRRNKTENAILVNGDHTHTHTHTFTIESNLSVCFARVVTIISGLPQVRRTNNRSEG